MQCVQNVDTENATARNSLPLSLEQTYLLCVMGSRINAWQTNSAVIVDKRYSGRDDYIWYLYDLRRRQVKICDCARHLGLFVQCQIDDSRPVIVNDREGQEK